MTSLCQTWFLIITIELVYGFVSPLRQYHCQDITCHPLQYDSSDSTTNKELHLLTFDLDDTIFPITPVVQDANSAMIQYLQEIGYENASNDEIIAASKQIRRELRERGEEVTYTELRKQSIRREMERLDGGALDTHESDVIDRVFDKWLLERHASADRNLFPFASSSLQIVRDQYPSVVIGAITNGRGSPFHMQSISHYFDFCISGEDDGVFPLRKPSSGIYEAALKKYEELKNKNVHNVNWIHVGDDLANDVGASAACGAKTIWLTKDEQAGEEGVGFWSTATLEEMQKRKQMNDRARQFVNAEVTTLNELSNAIESILSNKK